MKISTRDKVDFPVKCLVWGEGGLVDGPPAIKLRYPSPYLVGAGRQLVQEKKHTLYDAAIICQCFIFGAAVECRYAGGGAYV